MNDPAFMTQRELMQREMEQRTYEGEVRQEIEDIFDYFGDLSELLADFAPEISPLVKRLHEASKLQQKEDFHAAADALMIKLHQLAESRAIRRVERRQAGRFDE